MKSLKRSLPALTLITLTPLFMAALSVDIATPAPGTGATWDCTTVSGTSADERDGGGSTLTGGLWKKIGGIWSRPNGSGLGPLKTDATVVPTGSTNGTWSTVPDDTLNVAKTFTASGNYKVTVEIMDYVTFASASDNNLWTIP